MATIREIALALRDALASAKLVEASRVYVIARGRKLHNLVGNRDIVIRPRGFTTDIQAGRSNTLVTRNFDIMLRTRTALDTTNNDINLLLKEGVGQMEFEDAVFDAIQMWLGNSEEGSELLVGEGEPLRITGGSDPEKDEGTGDGKWGMSTLTAQITYRQSLDQERQ